MMGEKEYKVIFSRSARNELRDIAFYIALDNPEKSKTFISQIRQHFSTQLIKMPLSYRKIKGNVRMIPYKRYGALYCVDERRKLIKILHVFGGGQDWQQKL